MKRGDDKHRDGGEVLILLEAGVELAAVHAGAAEILDDEIDGLGL